MKNHISQFYYINLDRRTDRLKHMSKEINKSKIFRQKMLRYPAVDGRSLKLSSVPTDILNNEKAIETIKSKRVHAYGLSLTYGSIACAISHYNLFKKCAENKNGNILILEDDVLIPADIDKYIEKINSCNIYYDIFYLGIHRSKHSKILPIKNNEEIFNLKGVFWGGFAYVLTPKACDHIVNNVFPIYYQFDSEINRHVNSNKLTALYFGHNIIKSGHLSSDNQGKNGLINHEQNDKDIWLNLFV